MSKFVFRILVPVLVISGGLSGCSATNPNIFNSYDATQNSRVRVFVYTADRIRLDFDRTCYTSPGLLGHGEGLEIMQRSHYQGSRSVGMAPTSKRGDAVFDEFIIKAGIPLTIYGQVGGKYHSPSVSIYMRETRDAGYFMPIAGANYEIYVRDRKVIVEDLGVDGVGSASRLIELTPTKACAANGS